MKIDSAALQTQSHALGWQRRSSERQIDVSVDLPRPPANEVALSPSGVEASRNELKPFDLNAMRWQLLIAVVEMLTGRPVKFYQPEETADFNGAANAEAFTGGTAASGGAPQPPAIAVRYEEHNLREEAEWVSFAAKGSVTTADGRRFSFELDLQMARYLREESHTQLSFSNAPKRDPLVLNLSTNTAGLDTQTMRFDLDGDGKTEIVPLLAQGSVYLALDRNGNGRIDSGKELFGPKSGDGFDELAALDEDRNGWIDEGDSSFFALRLWHPGEALQTLQEADVGAIALERRQTPFSLQDEAGKELGAVRSTGIYLKESGGAGTAQQIDLVV